MAIYWIISYTILVFCVFELAAINQLREAKTRSMVNYFFFIFTVLLICFAGMRGPGSGIDDWQYLGFFHDFSNQTHISHFTTVAQVYRYENFFTLLAGFLSLFTKESYYFLLFVAIIAVSTNAWCYKKYSPLILCSLCLYSTHLFINKDMNQIRFGLCSAFAIASILLAVNRKYIWSAVMLVLSTQSHSTGYALVMVIPFLFLPQRKYWPLLMVFLAIPLGFIGGKKLFLDSLGIVPVVGDRATSYVGTTFDNNSPVISLANLKNIAFIVFFMVVYWGKNAIQKEDRLPYLLLIAYAIGAAVRMVFSDFAILGGRVGNLFLHAEPLLLALLMMRIRNLALNVALLGSMATYYLAYNTILSPQSVTGWSLAAVYRLF